MQIPKSSAGSERPRLVSCPRCDSVFYIKEWQLFYDRAEFNCSSCFTKLKVSGDVLLEMLRGMTNSPIPGAIASPSWKVKGLLLGAAIIVSALAIAESGLVDLPYMPRTLNLARSDLLRDAQEEIEIAIEELGDSDNLTREEIQEMHMRHLVSQRISLQKLSGKNENAPWKISTIAAMVAIILSVIAVYLNWRKEVRENRHSNIQLERSRLELQKLELELSDLVKKERGEPPIAIIVDE